MARKLVQDVRSSKREITYGLVIGVALSVLLGVFAKGYLERPYVDPRASSRGVAGAADLGGLPLESPSALESTRAERLEFERSSTAPHAPAQAHGELPLGGLPHATSRPVAERAALASRMSASLASLDVEAAEADSAPRARSKTSSRRSRPAGDTRAARTRAATSPQASDALEPEPSRGPAPLSPSESAGLGLELPL